MNMVMRTTATQRVVARPGRRSGRKSRVFERVGRERIARSAKLENAGPVVFLVVVAIAAVGLTLGYTIIG